MKIAIGLVSKSLIVQARLTEIGNAFTIRITAIEFPVFVDCLKHFLSEGFSKAPWNIGNAIPYSVRRRTLVEKQKAIAHRRPSDNFLPKRYTCCVQGTIGRVDGTVLTVLTASCQRRVEIGPYTIVCRRGHASTPSRALRPGVFARILFVATDEGPLAVLVEVVDQGLALGDRRAPPPRGTVAVNPVAAALHCAAGTWATP